MSVQPYHKVRSSNSGQALIVVLLILSVTLTVVLSAVSRSVTDISVTTYEEDAQRAFSGAEAGVERVLLTQTSVVNETLPNNVQVNANIAQPLPSDNRFIYPTELVSGETATFWLVSHLGNNLTCSGQACFRGSGIELCWGKTGAIQIPAIEASLYYDTTFGSVAATNDYTAVRLARIAVDPDDSGRRLANNFVDSSPGATCTISGKSFPFRYNAILPPSLNNASCSISLIPGCLLMAKVRMFYNTLESNPVGIRVTVAGVGQLPAQGTEIVSSGTAGESRRKVAVFQGYPEIPSIFDAAVFSFTDLVK